MKAALRGTSASVPPRRAGFLASSMPHAGRISWKPAKGTSESPCSRSDSRKNLQDPDETGTLMSSRSTRWGDRTRLRRRSQRAVAARGARQRNDRHRRGDQRGNDRPRWPRAGRGSVQRHAHPLLSLRRQHALGAPIGGHRQAAEARRPRHAPPAANISARTEMSTSAR